MQQMNVKVDINSLPKYKCSVCNGTFFAINSIMRNLPAMASPTGKPTAIMQQVGFRCCDCNSTFGQDLEKEVNDGRLLLINEEPKPTLEVVKS